MDFIKNRNNSTNSIFFKTKFTVKKNKNLPVIFKPACIFCE